MLFLSIIAATVLFVTPVPAETQATAQTVLLVRDHERHKDILKVPLCYGQTFTIRYIHSVDKAPVLEVFRAVKGKGLVLEETYFRMFGAGMGHWKGHGEVVGEGEWIKIKGIDHPLGSFLLRIGSPGVDHTVLLNGKTWNLSRMAPGRRVEVLLVDE